MPKKTKEPQAAVQAAAAKPKKYDRQPARGTIARVEAIAKHNGLTLKALERLCGLPANAISSLKYRQKTNKGNGVDASIYAEKILATFKTINARWLMTGEGGMLLPEALPGLTDADGVFLNALITASKEHVRRLQSLVSDISEELDRLGSITHR